MSFEDIASKAVEKGVETAVEKTLGIKDLKTVRAVAQTGTASCAAVSAAAAAAIGYGIYKVFGGGKK